MIGVGVAKDYNIARFILFFLLAFGSSLDILAQKTAPGFIVTLKGDTIRGFIQEGPDAELTSGITFKKTGSLGEVSYSPKTIYSFGFDYGRTFKQFVTSKYSDGNDSTMVFAKNNLYGKISMFTARIKNQDEPDIILVNNFSRRTVILKGQQKSKKVEQNGKTLVVESYQHIGALKIIKSDSLTGMTNPKKFKYSEKAIRKDILDYNEQFKENFPIVAYRPQVDYFYDVSAGLPVLNRYDIDVAFRVAVYRHKMFPEKSRNISFLRGFSYRYSYINPTIDPSVRNGAQNFRQQFLTIIPVGIGLQGGSKKVKPYFYMGAGLALLWQTNQQIVDYEDHGPVHEIIVLPALNVGGGLKIKVGSHFVFMEVTPTGNNSGPFVNLGYSF